MSIPLRTSASLSVKCEHWANGPPRAPSIRSRVLKSCHSFLETRNSPGKQTTSWRAEAQKREESEVARESEAEPDRMQSPTLFLRITPGKLCMHTCACTYMCVYQGSCFHMCPRAALQLFLDAACADLLAGPAYSRQFHPVGRERRRRSGGRAELHLHFCAAR